MMLPRAAFLTNDRVIRFLKISTKNGFIKNYHELIAVRNRKEQNSVYVFVVNVMDEDLK